MRKIKEYKAIGSVDTCRAAVAKTKGKNVIAKSGEADAHEAGNQSTKRYAYADCQNQEGEINGHCS